MIRIFDEGQGRERAGAIARGGLLVAAEERSELEKLLGLCMRCMDGEIRSGPYLASEGGDRGMPST